MFSQDDSEDSAWRPSNVGYYPQFYAIILQLAETSARIFCTGGQLLKRDLGIEFHEFLNPRTLNFNVEKPQEEPHLICDCYLTHRFKVLPRRIRAAS
ncbi:unnamed protein product [marine sediment metagenome]|uniref:Uncharacterized protein n=1 Tax=marine sediment metagenome TaxID=412755 RepID=X0ZW70_9ZZZZ